MKSGRVDEGLVDRSPFLLRGDHLDYRIMTNARSCLNALAPRYVSVTAHLVHLEVLGDTWIQYVGGLDMDCFR